MRIFSKMASGKLHSIKKDKIVQKHSSGSERNTSALLKDMGSASGSGNHTLKCGKSLKELMLY